jgi:hypothetical protein
VPANIASIGRCLQALSSWCSAEEIGVSCRLVPAYIVVVGWFPQALLSWCSNEETGVSYRLVPANIVIVGWFLHDNIKISFVVFSHLSFHVKSLCIVDCVVVYIFIINCLWMVK